MAAPAQASQFARVLFRGDGLMRRILMGISLLGASLPGVAAGAQGRIHHVTDSAIAGSLLLVSPLASLPPRAGDGGDYVLSRRVETQYSRSFHAVSPTQLVIGLRTDAQQRDSSDWSSLAFGIRAGIRGGENSEGAALSSLELSLGARNLGHFGERPKPNVGVDVVAGLSWLEADAKGLLAVRAPVELISHRSAGALSLSIVPALAWGHLRFRQCEDRGPGDNCGSLGVQLAAGVTRVVLGASLGASLAAGMAATVGVQHVFAPEQKPRLTAGLAFGR
jgi:hypothetical protein